MVFVFSTLWGGVLADCNENGLSRLDLPQKTLVPQRERFTPLEKEIAFQVRAYLTGELRQFSLPVDWRVLGQPGSFFRRVYQACAGIPFGQVLSYQELAEIAGSPKACRAVGQAMAKNQVTLVVPCHRVLAAGGSLGGFGGGLDMKKQLLQLEGAVFIERNGREYYLK